MGHSFYGASELHRAGGTLVVCRHWSAYMMADTAAIYALGHMSVLCSWSPEHQLMALWAPLLLVHLGGQDNISAYAIEDNRLWLRHLQTFAVQVAAAGYVLYMSSILTQPSNKKLSLAAMLMFVVGVVKYGERIWALFRANSSASSSLSATSYDKVRRTGRLQAHTGLPNMRRIWSWELLDVGIECIDHSHGLLNAAKQMFEGPTRYVQISNVGDVFAVSSLWWDIVQMQLSMMYDLLYTKACVVHTWYGMCSRVVISLPFTVIALKLFHSSLADSDDDAYTRVDVIVTKVLLTGAVTLDIMSVLRAILSRWTAVLLLNKGWNMLASVVFAPELFIAIVMRRLFRSGLFWSKRMRQHSIFKVASSSDINMGSKMAKRMGMEDWWDSNAYSWSTRVPDLVIEKILEAVSSTATIDDMTASRRQKALVTRMLQGIWVRSCHMGHLAQLELELVLELELEERILVWHIATHVYVKWYKQEVDASQRFLNRLGAFARFFPRRESNFTPFRAEEAEAVLALADYMFFLLAARPYMLPYPVSRQAYVQLHHDIVTHFPRYGNDTEEALLNAILSQKGTLIRGNPLRPPQGTGRLQGNRGQETSMFASAYRRLFSVMEQCFFLITNQYQSESAGYFSVSRDSDDEDDDAGTGPRQESGGEETDEGTGPGQESGGEETDEGTGRRQQNTTLDRGCQLAAMMIHETQYWEGQYNSSLENFLYLERRPGTAGDILNMLLEVWVEMLCGTAYMRHEKSHAKLLTDGGDIMTIISLFMVYMNNGFIRKDTRTSGGTSGSPSSQGSTSGDIEDMV